MLCYSIYFLSICKKHRNNEKCCSCRFCTCTSSRTNQAVATDVKQRSKDLTCAKITQAAGQSCAHISQMSKNYPEDPFRSRLSSSSSVSERETLLSSALPEWIRSMLNSHNKITMITMGDMIAWRVELLSSNLRVRSLILHPHKSCSFHQHQMSVKSICSGLNMRIN